MALCQYTWKFNKQGKPLYKSCTHEATTVVVTETKQWNRTRDLTHDLQLCDKHFEVMASKTKIIVANKIQHE